MRDVSELGMSAPHEPADMRGWVGGAAPGEPTRHVMKILEPQGSNSEIRARKVCARWVLVKQSAETLSWFPRVLGTRDGRYTIVAEKDAERRWRYLAFCHRDGIARPIDRAMSTGEEAKRLCEQHAAQERGPHE